MSNQTNVKFRLDNSELWGGLIGLALGIFVIWSGLKLKLGTINDPGSGYVLFYTGILICLFAATIIVAAVTEGGADLRLPLGEHALEQAPSDHRLPDGFAFALDTFGFLLSAIPLMVLLLRVIDPVRWSLAIPLSILAPLGMWWVLKHLLGIQLPSGMFEIG